MRREGDAVEEEGGAESWARIRQRGADEILLEGDCRATVVIRSPRPLIGVVAFLPRIIHARTTTAMGGIDVSQR